MLLLPEPLYSTFTFKWAPLFCPNDPYKRGYKGRKTGPGTFIRPFPARQRRRWRRTCPRRPRRRRRRSHWRARRRRSERRRGVFGGGGLDGGERGGEGGGWPAGPKQPFLLLKCVTNKVSRKREKQCRIKAETGSTLGVQVVLERTEKDTYLSTWSAMEGTGVL